MKRFIHAALAAWAFAFPAGANDAPVVVELFTSQGCSSCPPADELMSVLVTREDVIALSLHVDYWDYIGWKDEFADPEHAKRQRGYATTAGRRSVYTPEMIVNGESDIVGAKPMAVAMAIEAHKAAAPRVSMSLERHAGQVSVRAEPLDDSLEPMDVFMVRYQPSRVSRILRGENSGKTIKYVNVAQNWELIARWDGLTPLDISVDAPGALPLVVLVQVAGHGPIRAAARLP